MGIFKNFFGGDSNKSTIIVNGKKYIGNSVKIINDDVYIDGNLEVSGSGLAHNITVTGNLNELQLEKGYVTVEGDVNTLKTSSGDVEVTGDVYGGVNTSSGDVEVRANIEGNVNTSSGDVEVNKIVGDVSTKSGDIDKSFR